MWVCNDGPLSCTILAGSWPPVASCRSMVYLVQAIILDAAAFFSAAGAPVYSLYWSKPATGAHPARIVATQDDLRVSDIRPASVTFEVVQVWSCSSYILPNLAMKMIFKKPCNCIKADLHASIMDGFSYIEETRSTGLSGGCWKIPATLTVDSALWNAISGAKLL